MLLIPKPLYAYLPAIPHTDKGGGKLATSASRVLRCQPWTYDEGQPDRILAVEYTDIDHVEECGSGLD